MGKLCLKVHHQLDFVGNVRNCAGFDKLKFLEATLLENARSRHQRRPISQGSTIRVVLFYPSPSCRWHRNPPYHPSHKGWAKDSPPNHPSAAQESQIPFSGRTWGVHQLCEGGQQTEHRFSWWCGGDALQKLLNESYLSKPVQLGQHFQGRTPTHSRLWTWFFQTGYY